MTIKLYNTLTNKKEALETNESGKVKMYICGPTTYNYIHLGNARPIVVFDTIRRYLEYRGYEVTYVQNFTDIDDKIIKKASEEGVDPLALAQKYIKEYFADAEELNVREADIHPKVSDHLEEIVETISKLIETGHAYENGGDVYYHIEQFADYGKLSGRSVEEMQAGARVEVNQHKKHPMDFVLWKKAKPGEPSWDSPWGKGRPGWHIECTVMALKYLGENFDIHGGGYDLIFPHHENEIAQSEACTGKPFAKYWMHNGFITVNQEKMSKSLGNFFLVREILEKFDSQVVRFYLLSTHYRSPLDFDDEKLHTSEKGLARISNTYRRVVELIADTSVQAAKGTAEGDLQEVLEKLKQEFEDAMDDDFNTSLAIAKIFDLAREVNHYLHQKQEANEKVNADILKQGIAILDSFGSVLGMDFNKETVGEKNSNEITDSLLELLLDIRQQARVNKDWNTADMIRDRLKETGIAIEDTPQGARWKWQ